MAVRMCVILNMNSTTSGKALALFVIAFLLALGATTVNAQSDKRQKERVATKFDSFGRVGYCDLTARLDNLAVSLQGNDQRGYLMVYAPPGSGRDSGEGILERLKAYLVNSRGIDPEKFQTIYGGRNTNPVEPRVELWLGPSDAPPPEPAKAKLEPFKGMVDEDEVYDGVPFVGPEVFAEGAPGIDGTHVAGIVDVLEQQPDSVMYVVSFNGKEAVPGAWKRVAEDQVDIFKKAGIGAGRLKTIYGGKAKKTKIQVWIQPANEPPPVKDKGAEDLPKVAVQVGEYGEYELGYAENEKNALKRLQEVLLAYPTFRACLIVRIGQPPEVVAEETSEEMEQVELDLSVEDKPSPPPADVLKIAEKWKTEFAKHNIREDRLVILFSKAPPDYLSSLESWVVPQGKPLPDPEKPVNQD